MSTSLSNRLFRTVSAARRTAWVLAFGALLCAGVAPARAGTKVAVIDAAPKSGASGVTWCALLTSNGYDCRLFPHTGPTESLDPFQVIIDMSDEWADPSDLLADQMRKRKGVITWARAPFALQIDVKQVVQMWIGAGDGALGGAGLLTTAIDPIFGSTPIGSEISNCGAAACTGLIDEYPTSKVLARWEWGTGPIGILRNSWEGGQSVYFPNFFGPSHPAHAEVILRTMDELSRSIPATSAWGAFIAALFLVLAGSLIVGRRSFQTVSTTRPTAFLVAFGGAFCIAAPPARAGCKVAVIATPSGGTWCQFFAANGYDCTTFPSTGPTGPLNEFQVVVDLSDEWTDPTHSLADFMRAGKGVITWANAPVALGLDTDPIVQAWIGATQNVAGDMDLVTVVMDPIFESMPVGTELANCGLSICGALDGESAHPNARVLARWKAGTGPAGILWNSWEGGQSVYFPNFFGPSHPPNAEVILRSLEVLCRPIPTASTWGALIVALSLVLAGTLIVRRRAFRGKSSCVIVPVVAFLLFFHIHRTDAQAGQSRVTVRTNNGITTLVWTGHGTEPFHSTDRVVQDLRIMEVPDSQVLIVLWEETDSTGKAIPFYAISSDGKQIDRVTQTSHLLSLRYARFDPVDGSNHSVPLLSIIDSLRGLRYNVNVVFCISPAEWNEGGWPCQRTCRIECSELFPLPDVRLGSLLLARCCSPLSRPAQPPPSP